jgi:Domain of unknown function (DUF4407)
MTDHTKRMPDPDDDSGFGGFDWSDGHPNDGGEHQAGGPHEAGGLDEAGGLYEPNGLESDGETTQILPQIPPGAAYPYRVGRPEPAPHREGRDLGRWLRRFAGVDEDLLAWVPQERARYSGMGGAVLFTAIMAFLSMTVALGLAFSTRSPLILIPAAVWFVLILNFDRWLVSAPLSKNLWSMLPTLAVRMGMAVLFGIVIAEPLVLAVFNTAVHTQVLQSRADDLKKYQAQWERCNPIDLTTPTVTSGAAPATPAPPASPTPAPSSAVANSPQCADFVVPLPENVKALRSDFAAKQAQLASVQATLKPLNAQHDKLVKKSQDECLGKPGVGQTGRFGAGPVCRRLTQDAENYAKLNRIDDLEKNVVTLTNDVQSLSTQIRNASTKWADQRSAYIAARVQERAASNGKIGLLERIEALNTLARTHAALGGAIWAVRGLFILIDLAPALLKYTSGQTRYDRLVESSLRVGEARFNATMQTEIARAQLWAEDSEGDLDVERARSAGDRTAQYDRIMDNLERHWATSAEAATLSRPVRAGAPTGRGWPEATSRYTYDPDLTDREEY